MNNMKHYYIELRLLLTKLLSIKTDGVTYKDLIEYKNFIYNIRTDDNVVRILEGININSLERLAIDYPEQFRLFNNKCYQAVLYNPDYFNSSYLEDINKLLDKALFDYNQSKVLKPNNK